MIKKKNFDIYAWACDLENFRGEGILGRNFIKHLSLVKKNKLIFVETPGSNYLIKNNKLKEIKKKKNLNLNFNFFYNYLFPFIGIFKICYFNRGKEKCYINFLPLWNFLIFLFLPKNTILGPITGSLCNTSTKNLNDIIRKYFFPFFYRLSVKIVKKNKIKILLSTELLKKFTNKIDKRKLYFNYNLINFENQKKNFIKRNKDIDFLFYHRKYSAHDSASQIDIVKKLSKKKFKIVVIGDHLNLPNVQNKGIVSRKKVFNLLRRTKFSINESTNFYSIYLLDCIATGVRIFYNKKTKINKFLFPKKYFIEIDFNDSVSSTILITDYINKYRYFKNLNFKKDIFLKNFNNYFI